MGFTALLLVLALLQHLARVLTPASAPQALRWVRASVGSTVRLIAVEDDGIPLGAVAAPANRRDDGLLAATLQTLASLGPLPTQPAPTVPAAVPRTKTQANVNQRSGSVGSSTPNASAATTSSIATCAELVTSTMPILPRKPPVIRK